MKKERKDNDDEEADAGGPEEIIAQSILIGSIVCLPLIIECFLVIEQLLPTCVTRSILYYSVRQKGRAITNQTKLKKKHHAVSYALKFY